LPALTTTVLHHQEHAVADRNFTQLELFGKAVKKRGYHVRGMSPANKSPAALEEDILRRYAARESGVAIANALGTTKTTVYNVLRRHGKARRSISEASHPPDFRHDYFSRIDCEPKAYWLGFIVADGCVNNGGRAVTFTAAERDAGHLALFRDEVRSVAAVGLYDYRTRPFKMDGVVYQRKDGTPTEQQRKATLAIGSIQMCSDLIGLGVTPAKSLTATVPVIRDDLYRHFWRGVVDGDGCISQYSTRRVWELSLVGSKEIVAGFSAFANGVTSTRAMPRQRRNIWVIKYSGRALPARIARELYDNTTVALARKSEKALALVELCWPEQITR
jgi:hypothetical protein